MFEVVVIVISSNKKAKVKHGKGGGTLSFSMEEEEDGEDCEFKGHQSCDVMFYLFAAPSPEPVPVQKKRKLGKNPAVDTSFLPDRDREVKVHDAATSPEV